MWSRHRMAIGRNATFWLAPGGLRIVPRLVSIVDAGRGSLFCFLAGRLASSSPSFTDPRLDHQGTMRHPTSRSRIDTKSALQFFWLRGRTSEKGYMLIKVNDAECHNNSPSPLFELPAPDSVLDHVVERVNLLASDSEIASFSHLDFMQDEDKDVSSVAPFPSMGEVIFQERFPMIGPMGPGCCGSKVGKGW